MQIKTSKMLSDIILFLLKMIVQWTSAIAIVYSYRNNRPKDRNLKKGNKKGDFDPNVGELNVDFSEN